VRVDSKEVRLQASDSAGRSAPYFAALVAVQDQNGRLRFARNPVPGQGQNQLEQEGVLLLPISDEQSPYSFAIKRAKWPDSALVLLLRGYLQPRGIRGEDRPRQRTWFPIDTNAEEGNIVSLAIEAMRQAIQADTVSELRTGLVRAHGPELAAPPYHEQPSRRALCSWLLSHKNAEVPKFFLTPSAFLPRQLNVARDPVAAIHSDAWDGYPLSQHGLLKFVFDNDVRGLVLLFERPTRQQFHHSDDDAQERSAASSIRFTVRGFMLLTHWPMRLQTTSLVARFNHFERIW